jgi:hypothetical protein
VLSELRLRAAVVILSSSTQISLVKSLVEKNCLIVTTEDAGSVLTPPTTGECSLCLVDGRLGAASARLLETCGITRILGTRGLQRSIPHWTHESWTAAHWSLGGVTTKEVTGVCLTLGSSNLYRHVIQPSVGRDASTVLSVQAPAQKYQPGPPSSTMTPLGCEQLETELTPIYHGDGLLPGKCDKCTVVLTPGLFAPKGNWAHRNLNLDEVLTAKDCGRVAASLMGYVILTNVFLRHSTPGKCLVTLATQWGCNGGGNNAFFLIPNTVEILTPPTKKSKQESSIIRFEPVNDTRDLEDDKNTNGNGSSVLVASDGLLEEVSRENRERKAVKSDDAAVPKYLWEEHLTSGSRVKEWNDQVMHDLINVLRWLRKRMLAWWKQKVESSYVTWMKAKYSFIEEDAKDATVQANLVGKGKEWFRYGRDCYAWADDGRDAYRKWWKERLVRTIEDIVPASDVIARSAKSSWWGWDDGSRSFHWRWPSHCCNITYRLIRSSSIC